MDKISPHLNEETKIVWLKDPAQYPYVREKFERMPFRSRFAMRAWRQCTWLKLLGYSEISLGAKQIHDGFYRRIWYLRLPGDPYAQFSPAEGVKPSSIKPRQPSEYGRE
jgi:hypothetical protein